MVSVDAKSQDKTEQRVNGVDLVDRNKLQFPVFQLGRNGGVLSKRAQLDIDFSKRYFALLFGGGHGQGDVHCDSQVARDSASGTNVIKNVAHSRGWKSDVEALQYIQKISSRFAVRVVTVHSKDFMHKL